MMATTTILGLRERARTEHAAAVERIAEREREHHEGDQGRLVARTEELLLSVLGLRLAAPAGYVEIEGLRIGARFHRYAGHTAWRLCLLEPCAVCGEELATPLLAGVITLGALLAERDAGQRPAHPVSDRDCWAGVRR